MRTYCFFCTIWKLGGLEERQKNAWKNLRFTDTFSATRRIRLKVVVDPFLKSEYAGKTVFQYVSQKNRVLVENTFGRIKRRFHLLHSEDRHRKLVDIVKDIRTCGVLHNIAVKRNEADFSDSYDDNQPVSVPYEGPVSGQETRDFLVQNHFS